MNSSKEDFDAFANDYREIHTEQIKKLSEFNSEYFSEYKIQIIKNTLKNNPQNILDFGCGDGTSCEFFRKYFPESHITGIDVSSESIKIAQSKQIQNASLTLYDGNELPFDINKFDLIFAAGVFHHIKKQKHYSLIQEINRVLAKNGKLFIFEHNPFNPFTKKIVKDCIFDKEAELIHPNFLKKIIQKSNFQNTKINYTLFFPRYHFFEKLFSFEKHLKWCLFGAQYYIESTKIN